MRLAVRLLAGALLLAALLAPGTAPAYAAEVFPDVIQLPNGWLPEGVATGRGPVIYSGSRANGAIYAANLRTGEGEIIVPGQTGRVAVGLSFDARTNYIFVAGGPTGKAYIYDASTGAQVREYTLTTSATFVNDVIVTRDAAYFTDSARAVLYRVPLGAGGRLDPGATPEEITLGGDWVQVPGFIDDYAKRVAAQRAESEESLLGFRETAARFFNADLNALVAHYRASTDEVMRSDAESVACGSRTAARNPARRLSPQPTVLRVRSLGISTWANQTPSRVMQYAPFSPTVTSTMGIR